MNTWEIVLARKNDERHYYIETNDGETAIEEAKAEWLKEFGPMLCPRLISFKKMQH